MYVLFPHIYTVVDLTLGCGICYNEFGARLPEGFTETPVSLPQCNHIYGDYCIKKWFEESDNCPMCRTKYKSEIRIYVDRNALGRLMGVVGKTLDRE